MLANPPDCLRSRRWWARQDSNLQPSRYERPALPLSYRPSPVGRRDRQGWRTPSRQGSGARKQQREGIAAADEVAAGDPREAAHQPKVKASGIGPRSPQPRTARHRDSPRSAAGPADRDRAPSPARSRPRAAAARRARLRSASAPNSRNSSRSASSGSTRAATSPRGRATSSFDARSRRAISAQLARLALDQRSEVDPLARSAARRMDLGRKIEVVDRGQQQPRLANDLRGAFAIAAVGRARDIGPR